MTRWYIILNLSPIGDFLNEYSLLGGSLCVTQVMHIMSQSLEGFSLPYMKKMATTQDLDSYRVVITDQAPLLPLIRENIQHNQGTHKHV